MRYNVVYEVPAYPSNVIVQIGFKTREEAEDGVLDRCTSGNCVNLHIEEVE